MSDSAALSVTDLCVDYGAKRVLDHVTLQAARGRITAVIGPNGAGKSTLIKAVMGLIPISGGNIELLGQKADRLSRKRVAYMPQRNAVDWDFPASALDVVAMGLYAEIGWGRPVRRRHLDEALACLEQVGLDGVARRPIGQMSGGQQQRVFLARALAQKADLYLMDEPFAGVDAATEASILQILKDMKAGGRTVICVHHDLQTVADYFDDAIALNVTTVATGPVSEIMRPETLQRAYGGRLLLVAP
ncbi:MAG: metal ABC transporter ATP-binding protein [Micavibrio aeruginosavorus]|uniref:Metal ABC transporter ATP-binding protein n=1 Tax=Micavibrio aeruginosavorus TaxID=349221 RepID=A0A7T5R213_9BACT|nr:MAG: metal ABC transporter ATP-binding protein [Micavibrio aeruginosavorus]